MKCLTLMQPWAWAVVSGRKRVENRSWRTDYRGALLIHAGLSRRALADLDELPDGSPVPAESELVFGAALGVVELLECVPADDPLVRGDPFAGGPWCWLLAKARRLRRPYFCRGALGLWTPPAGLARALARCGA